MISNRYIDWKAFTPSYVESEMPRLIAEASQALDTIENSEISSYEDLVYALNDATYKLYRMWGALSHLLSVMNSKEWREVQEKYQGEIVAFSLRVGQSQKLYLSAKKLLESNAANDPVRRRILEKMVQSAELSGVSLEGEKKERFNAIAERLAQLGSDFRNAVIDSTPAEISDAVFPEVMKNDPDRSKRERLYRLRSTRAPSNSERIDEMLRLRDEEAKMLGFRNYAEKSLATKSAEVPSAAFAMIDKLDAATAEAAETEEKELAEFSKDELEPWDRAYAAERLREAKYDYSEEELKKYFELETTLAGLFRLTKTLFGVDVEEVSPDEKPPVWHDDVRFFRVKEEGRVIAEFYFDPFVRVNLKSGGAWMNEFSNLSVRKGEKPLALIVMNLPERDENAKVFMPFREVETLFHEFGHALQCMLTRVTEEDAAGINLVEWDAVEVASQFMENWCLNEMTGIEIPSELKEKVRSAKNFRAASQCRRQLAFAKTDLILHSEKLEIEPNALKNEVFGHFGLPLIPEDRFLNAFSHIFSGGYSAGYYSYKWAEVMSVDCYGAFEEIIPQGTIAVKELGRRYRETILSLGGSKSALEIFRLFRARDPEIESLLRQQGLVK